MGDEKVFNFHPVITPINYKISIKLSNIKWIAEIELIKYTHLKMQKQWGNN